VVVRLDEGLGLGKEPVLGIWLACKETASSHGPKSLRSNPASLLSFPDGIAHSSVVGVRLGGSPQGLPMLFLNFLDVFSTSPSTRTAELPEGEEGNLLSLLAGGPVVLVFGFLTGSGAKDAGVSGIFAVRPDDLMPVPRNPDSNVTGNALTEAYALTLN
jgi:hypothetical protein